MCLYTELIAILRRLCMVGLVVLLSGRLIVYVYRTARTFGGGTEVLGLRTVPVQPVVVFARMLI